MRRDLIRLVFFLALFALSNNVFSAAAPANDNCAGATPLTVNATCTYSNYTNVNATESVAPVPGCANWIAGSMEDVWFSVTVPASGQIILDTQTGGITDGGMAIYSGTCGALTLIECDDDDSGNGLMPYINRTGLTPGSTIYIRVWEYGGDVTGTFGICAYSPVPTCTDGIQNGTETGIDCGGTCPACGVGSTCATANVIAALPYTGTATTCGAVNDYDSGDACASSYMNGQDYLYQYTPATNQVVNIALTGTLTYTGVFVYDGCPGQGATNCVGMNTNSAGNPAINCLSLPAGDTYYIMVDTWPSPDCTPFTINITSSAATAPVTINACSGTFYDTGGAGGNYGACQDYVVTYCPSTPGMVIEVNFTTWNVEPGTNDDQMIVHDGNSVGSPTMFFADGLNSGLGQVQASITNPTGCLTFEWTSDDDAITGPGWAATISCSYPCQLVQSTITSTTPAASAGYINICQGQNVAFNATGTYPQNGTYYTQANSTSTFTWDFGDGTQLSGVNLTSVNHTYPTEGGYNVNLTITDVNGCESTNNINIRVRVSMTPHFVGTNTNDNTLCLGQCATLTGLIQPQPFVMPTGQVLADTTFLPDGSGVTYTTSLEFNNFSPGQVLTASTDIVDICCEIEHSYIGDLIVWIECPNGATTMLFDGNLSPTLYQYLGVPLGGSGHSTYDNTPLTDPTVNLPGTPWNYCFDMTAGTQINATATPGDQSIPAGDYHPQGTWADLIGCPLNGTWTIHITDDVGADNGWIYSWGINFLPSIYPPLWSFTNTYPTQWWTGNGVTGTNPATACPTVAGVQNYVFHTTDNYGCSYDTTITITVTGLTVTTSHVNPTCNGYSNGTATVTAVTGGTAPYTYLWNDPAPAQTTATCTGLPAGTWSVTVTDANGCQGYSSQTLTNPPGMTIAVTGAATTCGLNNGSATATITAGNNPYDYLWSSGQLTNNTNSLTNTISSLPAGTYTVTVTDDDGCTVSGSYVVAASTAPVSTPTHNGNDCFNGNSVNFTNNGTHGGTYAWSFPGGATPATSTTENPTNVSWPAAGTYTVTLTVTLGGCTATNTVNVTIYPRPTITITPTNPTCFGYTNGQAVAVVSSGTAPYTYVWNDPAPVQTTATCTGLGAGTWSVTVSDANGCTNTASTTLTQPAVLTASASSTNVLCNGACTGTASATGVGGTAPYSYSWSNGSTNANLTNLCIGAYTVTVTSTGGCTASTSVNITSPPALTASIVPTNVVCNGASTGAANLTPGGGNGTYTYLWSSGQTTQDLASIPAGTYTVTVTDGNGCTITASTTITQPTAVTASISAQTNVSCNGGSNGSATVAAGGGTAPYTYLWNDPAPQQTTATATGLTAGTWTVTVTSTGGCTTTASVTITQPPALTASITAQTNVACNGGATGSATVTPTGGTAPYTYAWNDPAPIQTTATATALTAGTWTVTVTSVGGCTTTASVTITQPPVLTASITAQTNILCNGGSNGSATVTAAGGTAPYTYLWNDPAPAQTTATATALTAGTWTVTVTSVGGCTATASVTITQPTLLTSAITAQTNVACNGGATGSATVTPTGGTAPYTYAWNDPAPIQTTATATALTAGTWNVTVTDANGCTSLSSVTITQPAALTATITAQTNILCNGGATGSATVTAGGGTPAYTYLWNDPAPAQTTATATALTAGTWTVTVTSVGGCTATASVTITQPTLLTSAITAQTNVACNGGATGSATVTPTGGTAPYTYAWNDPAPIQTTATATALTAGTWNVTVTDANGCTSTTSVTITQPPVLTASITAQTNILCNGGSNGTATVTAGGGTAPYTYLWNDPAPAQTTATATALTAGTWTVTVTSVGGCTATASVTITQPTLLTSAITAQTNVACNGGATGSATVTPTGGTAPYTYAWNDPAPIQTTATATALTAGTWNVTVTDANGCTSTTSVTITQPAPVTAAITAQTNIACNGGATGTATVTAGGGTPAYSYLWNDPAPAQTTATVTALTAGTWNVTVTDANGCTATTSVTITQPVALTASAVGTNPGCNGATTGSVDLTPAGGTVAYSYSWSNGATSQDISGVLAGTYTVTVTDANGCTATASATITAPPALTASIAGTNAGCNGASTGAANLTPGGGTPAYTYAWSSGPTTQDLTNIPAGTYTVTVTDANGCTITSSYTVTQPTALTASIAGTNAGCNGASTGAANLTPGGGTPAYTYAWSSGPTTQDLTNIPAGTYTVTVTDANGCTITASYTVTQPTAVTASISASTNVSCNGGSNGSATVTPGGGTPAYTYLWNDPAPAQTTATCTGLTAGTWTVTVTDANGCTQTATATITQPVVLTVAGSHTNVTCNAACNGSATATPAGGTAPYTYSWNDPGFQTTATTTSTLCAGTFSVTVTDANGCTATTSQTITQPVAITVTMSSVDASCGGSDGSASVVAAGGTPGYTYLWNSGGTTSTINLIPSGSYTVTVTDANGCTIAGTVSVNDGGAPTATITASTNVSCNGACDGTATVSAVGGTAPYTYNWSSVGNTATETGICAGTVSVTVTDAFGCVSTANVAITQPTALNASITASTNVSCNGGSNGSATVSASGGTAPYTYLWNDPAPAQTTPTSTALTAGSWTVTVTDAHGCTITATATITQPTLLTAAITATTNVSCNGGNNGSATVTASNGTPGYTYSWPAGGSLSTQTNLAVGSYTVTVTDLNGCTATATATITQPTALTASIAGTNAGCNGASTGAADLTPGGGTPVYTYAWSSGPITQDLTNIPSGTYTVTVTDVNGCTVSANTTITQPTALTASVTGTNAGCNGASTGAADLTPGGGTPAYTYAWSSGPTTQDLTNIPSGTYTVIVTDANGCTISASTTITQPTAVTAAITGTTNVSCNGGSDGTATVTAGGGTPAYTYLWNDPAPAQTSLTATGLTVGSWTVTVTDANGCSVSAIATITQPTPLTASATATNALCNGACDGTTNLTVSGGTAAYSYNWSNGFTSEDLTGLCANSYSVTVTDAEGCTATASATVTEPATLTVSIISSSDVTVFGSSDGSATAGAAAGTAPYSYDWSPNGFTGDGTATYSGLPSGTYTVTVTDANGCTATTSVIINEPGAIVLATTTVDASCNGTCDGEATVSVTSGGVPPFTYLWTGGATTSAVTGLCAGTYSVVVTDDNGGTATASVTINQPSSLTAAISATVNVSCNGGSNGSATVTAGGGTPSYTYLWNDPAPAQTTVTATGLTAGSWTVTVTDANGCTIATTATITQPAALTASAVGTPALCNGACDGTANLTVSGGTAAYSYVWSNGFTSEDLTGLCANTYNVTVTDAQGCTANASVTITQPVILTAAITSSSDVTIFGASDGSATVAGSNGTPPYSYDWSPNGFTGDGTATYSGLPVGTYTVTITDANGCTATASVTINEPGAIVLTTTTVDVSCNGICDGEATVAVVSGGVPTFNYLWPSGGTATLETGLCAGSYTVTVTDANGGTATATVTINQPTALTVSIIASSNVSCNGGSDGTATLSAGGGTPAYTYLWSNGNTGVTATGLAAGSHSVVVTDANGCTATVSVTITQPAILTASATGINALCSGSCNGSANLTVAGGTVTYSYNWTTGEAIEDVSGLCAGTYSVTVTDSEGCTATASVTINEPTVLTATTSTLNSNCSQSDGEASVVASGGTPVYTYLWSSGGNGSTETGIPSGNYFVTVTDANGCSVVQSATVTDLSGGTVSITSQTNVSCFGGNNGSATATPVGGTAPYNYLWSSGGVTATATGLTVGTYTVTVTDDVGCAASTSVTITEPTVFSAAITATTNVSCFGGNNGSLTVTANGGVPAYTYLWTGGSTSGTATGLVAGTYTVTVTDVNGCTAQATGIITQPTALTAAVTFSSNLTCFNSTNGQATVTASGGTTPYSYTWDGGSTPTSDANTGFSAGTFNVTVTDANLCTATASVTITQPTALVLVMSGVNENCGQENGSASVVASGGTVTTGYVYDWDDVMNSTTSTASNLSAGTYCVTVTDNNGCTATNCTVISNISPGTLTLTHTDITCNGACDGVATASFAGGVLPLSYEWNDPASQTTSTATNLCPGLYQVSVTDAVGCLVKDTLTITEPPAISNVFTSVNPMCNGACDGSITATPAGGTPGYSYDWSDPMMQTTITATGLCVGTFTVTITDNNGCTFTDNATLTEPAAMVITGVALDAHCGQADGELNITVTNGVAPFTYIWNNGETTEDVVHLLAGSYCVTATDANGCTATNCFTINNISGPTASITASTNISCFGVCDGTATVTASGGTPPYYYLWTGGQITQSATNLCAGSQAVTVTDDAGCAASANVTLTQPVALTSNSSSTQPLCNGGCDGTATVNAFGGTTPYVYLWNAGGATTSQFNTGLCDGSYTVVVTDNHGCTTSQTVNVTEPTFIALTTAMTPATCFGYCDGNATVFPIGGTVTTGYDYLWSDPAAQTTQSASGLCAGSYTVTVTDDNGCTATISVTVSEPTLLTASIGSSQDVQCNGACDGWADVNYAGGTPGYTFNWSAGGTTEMVNALCAGNHSVTVTDGNGCTASANITLTEPAALSLVLIPTNEECYAACDGSINTVITGGTTPYDFSWTNAASTEDVTGLCVGSYCVTVTDDHGCTINNCASISGPSILDITVTSIQHAHCGLNDGSATVSIIGGVVPYSYSWSNGSMTNSIIDVLSGNYTLTVTDGNGCTAVEVVSISDLDGPNVDNIAVINVSCFGGSNGSLVASASGGTGALTYLWNNGTPTAANTGLTAGIYTVTVTDATGCFATGNATVTQPTLLTININSTTDPYCFGGSDGSASSIAFGGTTAYTYLWSNGNTGSSATGLSMGSVSVTVTDAYGCTATDTDVLDQPTQVVITEVSNNPSTCFGYDNAVVEIAVTGGTPVYDIMWMESGNTNSIEGNLAPGTHSVCVTDDHGCMVCDDFVTTEPTGIVATTDSDPTTCDLPNGSAYITSISGGTGSYSYLWSPSNQTSSVATGLAEGDHILNISDGNGCTVTYTVTVGSIPAPTWLYIETDSVSCFGGSDGSAQIQSSDAVLPYSYEWSNGQTSPVSTGMPVGQYWLTITDANGCVISQIFTVNQPPQIVINANGATTICQGQATTISASAGGGVPPYTYYWSDPSFNNEPAQYVHPSFSTTYTVFVVDANGCTSSNAVVEITVNPPIDVAAIPAEIAICIGESTTLISSATGGDGGPYNYIWTGSTDHDNQIVVSPTSTTVYEVYATDGCGSPSDTAYVNVIVQEPPLINVTADVYEGCEPVTVTFSNFTTEDSVSYVWNFGDPSSGTNNVSTLEDPTHEFINPGTYDISITAISSAGCESSQTYENMIHVYAIPEAAFNAFPMVTSVFHSNVDFYNASEDANEYYWSFGDGHESIMENPSNHYDAAGTYHVMLVVESDYGCVDTAYGEIIIQEEVTFYAPTGITPGNGGRNQFFVPVSIGMDEDTYHIAIYDRWGEIIFESNDFTDYWNGRFQGTGEFVELGTYTWLVTFRDINGVHHEFAGSVTVIR